MTLASHRHEQVARSFNHVQMGFEIEALRAMFTAAGFRVDLCAVTSRERRAPHLAVVSVYATRHAHKSSPAGAAQLHPTSPNRDTSPDEEAPS